MVLTLGITLVLVCTTAFRVSGSVAAQEDMAPSVVWVTPSDDQSPVYLYNSPHEGDRAFLLAAGTHLDVESDEVEGDGQRWYVVRTPDDVEGYIALVSITPVEPEGASQ